MNQQILLRAVLATLVYLAAMIVVLSTFKTDANNAIARAQAAQREAEAARFMYESAKEEWDASKIDWDRSTKAAEEVWKKSAREYDQARKLWKQETEQLARIRAVLSRQKEEASAELRRRLNTIEASPRLDELLMHARDLVTLTSALDIQDDATRQVLRNMERAFRRYNEASKLRLK